MKIVFDGYIVGWFPGYAPGRIYTLSDGSTWQQEGGPQESMPRDRPEARLVDDNGALYLDVIPCSSRARVVRCKPAQWKGAGAY